MVVGEFTQEADLVIIGGGPAGYSAAFRAAELGVPAIIVESRAGTGGASGGGGALGGVCLHEGCIPSKTLLHVADTIHLAERAGEMGVRFAPPKLDLAAIHAWKNKTVSRLSDGLEALSRKSGLERIQGLAHFEDSRTLAITEGGGANTRIRFKKALIAAGSTHKHDVLVTSDGRLVLTPAQAVCQEALPRTLLIAGHDYMALELAAIFSALGSKVTLVNEGSVWLPEADADLVRPLMKALERRLSAIHVDRPIKRAEGGGGRGVKVSFGGDDPPKPATFDQVVVSAGQIGHVRALHLEKTQVKLDVDQFISVDEQMRTNDPRVFAAGDVTGPPFLASRAMAQGRVAAEVIAGHKSAFEARAIPVTIFTDPQIAWCGLTESAAQHHEIAHEVLKVPWGASGRAVGMGRSDGLTKIIFDPDSKLMLGAGMVGAQACELISEAMLAIEMGATLTDLALTIHPHPTISELLSDAARKVK